MNKISLYIFLVFIFLGLSVNFAPSIRGILFINNEKDFPNYFHEQPMSIILIDSFESGFLIKTYFQRYQIVYGFRPTKSITVKTSKKFWLKTKSYIGMSLFRRNEIDGKEALIPMPPGLLFVGDLSYGHWANTNSGQKRWVFHKAYQNFPKTFNWGHFIMTKHFYLKSLIFAKSSKPFYGIDNEFGTEGLITKPLMSNTLKKKRIKRETYFEYFKKYFKINKKNYSYNPLPSKEN